MFNIIISMCLFMGISADVFGNGTKGKAKDTSVSKVKYFISILSRSVTGRIT